MTLTPKPWDGMIADHRKAGGRTVFIFGPRGCGKSYMHNHLVYLNHKKYYMCIGVSMAEPTCAEYAKYTPESLVFRELNEGRLESMYGTLQSLDRMRLAAEKEEQADARRRGVPWDEAAFNAKYPRVPQILLNLDDATDGKGVFNHKIVREMYARGRHVNLTVMFATQCLTDASTQARINTDIILAPASATASEHEKLYKEFFRGAFAKKADYFAYVRRVQSIHDRAFIVLDKLRSGSTQDQMFYYVAPPGGTPPFRIGVKGVWLNDHRYRKRRKRETRYEVLRRMGMGSRGVDDARQEPEPETKDAEDPGVPSGQPFACEYDYDAEDRAACEASGPPPRPPVAEAAPHVLTAMPDSMPGLSATVAPVRHGHRRRHREQDRHRHRRSVEAAPASLMLSHMET